MRSDRHPPAGSAITMTESSAGIRYTWPADGSRGLANVGSTAFLVLWLVGWAMGERFAIISLFGGESTGPASLFLVVWLCLWTVGGVACLMTVVQNLRPLRPAVLLLDLDEIVYETGTRRPALRSDSRRNSFFPEVLEGMRNRTHRIPVREVGKLELERVGEQLRLSLDHQSRRIEIGRNLGEPDKEWLHSLLRSVVPES